MGFQAPITIGKVIERMETNEYVLPAIQREFVWSPEQIERLFDSLLRGYPIGSFLFWSINPANLTQYQFYRFMDRYHERDCRHNEPLKIVGHRPLTAVLDGQQRLTALNIGLKGYYAAKVPWARWTSDHAFPPRQLYLNLLEPAHDSRGLAYDFRMMRDGDVKAAGKGVYWFRIADVLQFDSIQKAFFYCVANGLASEGNQYPSETLMKLWSAVKENLVINYYEEAEQDLDKVLNIFIRVNSGGTVLSYSDMLLSIATAQWHKKDARKEVNALVDDLNGVGEGFQFSKDFVLKASLVLADIPAIEFRVASFTLVNMLKIESLWEKIAQALRLTTELVASWGYNWQTLVSNNAVIPLAYYLFSRGCPENFGISARYEADRSSMRRWLAVVLLKRTFGGQPDYTLRQARHLIQGQPTLFPADGIATAFRGTPNSIDFGDAEIDGLLDYSYGDKYTFSVLALLYPWLRYDQRFHIDHIFPRAMFTPKVLAKKGIPEARWKEWTEHVNDLANLQLLQGIPNQEKSGRDFGQWLTSTCPTPQLLEAYKKNNFIPDTSLDFENFPTFLRGREELLKQRLGEVLKDSAT